MVDLVERLPGLDLGAFSEQALLDDPIDLRTHLGDAVRSGTTRQLGGQGEGLRMQGNHTHFRHLGGRRRSFLLAAG
ncbi:hypothetical protein D9M68_793110 [compost metagenome]